MSPRKHQYSIFHQICHLIPGHLVSKLAKKHGVNKKCRTFSEWSHVVAMLFMQLAHSLSLNDVCDTLRNNKSILSTVRGATPPSRNGLSHANKIRDGQMAEDLFWEVLSHIQNIHPKFGIKNRYSKLPWRFKRTIVAVDSSTIKLVANCMDWAKHRRRKAAAKCHMQLNLQTFLPQFAIVKAANSHDSTEAKELCANLNAGEIAVFDKAYIDFDHLWHLECRDVFWVTAAKSNMTFYSVGQHTEPDKNILQDLIIEPAALKSSEEYPKPLRYVEAEVEIDKKKVVMAFITNNFDWAPSSICDLYKSRWGIEVFFKQIKQTLQLADFLGYSENAIKWQVWIGMLCYILLRYISELGKWKGSFKRLYTLLRGVLLRRFEMFSVIDECSSNNPRGSPRMIAKPQQLFLPNFKIPKP